MNAQTMAKLFGVLFLAVALLGFVPGLVQPPAPGDPPLTVDSGHGRLLGLFPVNLLHNLVHLLFGLWGFFASRSLDGSRGYFKVIAVAYGLLTVLGLIPATNTTFGLVPIHGNDVWLHAAFALVAAYFGFRGAEPAPARA